VLFEVISVRRSLAPTAPCCCHTFIIITCSSRGREKCIYTTAGHSYSYTTHSIYRCLTDRTIRKVQKHTDSLLGSWATYPSAAAVIGFFSLLVAQKTNTKGE
jgi:hypothetical protein